jgi:hypothetical protein
MSSQLSTGLAFDIVERARLDRQIVEGGHIVHFPVRNVDKTRNVAAQVEQRVQLDRAFAAAKLRPRKQVQTQVDRRGVERAQLHGRTSRYDPVSQICPPGLANRQGIHRIALQNRHLPPQRPWPPMERNQRRSRRPANHAQRQRPMEPLLANPKPSRHLRPPRRIATPVANRRRTLGLRHGCRLLSKRSRFV